MREARRRSATDRGRPTSFTSRDGAMPTRGGRERFSSYSRKVYSYYTRWLVSNEKEVRPLAVPHHTRRRGHRALIVKIWTGRPYVPNGRAATLFDLLRQHTYKRGRRVCPYKHHGSAWGRRHGRRGVHGARCQQRRRFEAARRPYFVQAIIEGRD